MNALLMWPADPEEEPNGCVTKEALLPRCGPLIIEGQNIVVAKDFIHLIETYGGQPPEHISE